MVYRTGERLLSYQKPENVSIANGLLRIALKKEDVGKCQYTAGGVISRQTFKYGYYEARFRCPKTAGWHTAFWTMQYFHNGDKTNGVDFAQQVEHGSGAVKAQEIDICEQDSVNNRSYSAGVIDWSGKIRSGLDENISVRPVNQSRISRPTFICGAASSRQPK